MTLADISQAVPRYEDDFVLWAERQVELRRQPISTGIDRDFFAKDCPFSLAEILEQP